MDEIKAAVQEKYGEAVNGSGSRRAPDDPRGLPHPVRPPQAARTRPY